MSAVVGPRPYLRPSSPPAAARPKPLARRSSQSPSSPVKPSPPPPPPTLVRGPRHTLKQLKFVLPGALVTYLLGTLARFWHLVADARGWARITARTSLACALLTVGLFLYIMLVPWVTGVRPNYQQWRQSADLALVVPLLTTLMVLGWPLLSYTLSHWTDLGLFKGTIASSGLYALVLGLLGLIPSPSIHRQ